MLHENGKKHQENVERALIDRRQEKKEEEQASKFLADSLRQMEQAALQATGMAPPPQAATSAAAYQRHHYHVSSSHHQPMPHPAASWSAPPPPPPPPPSQPQPPSGIKTEEYHQQNLQEWQAKKKQKEEERKRKKDGDSDDDEDAGNTKSKRRKIAPNEGHYKVDSTTIYMEGQVFYGILEADMPVQLWTGSNLASLQEKKLPANAMHWQNALVLAVRKKQPTTKDNSSGGGVKKAEEIDDDDVPIVSVTYLASPDAEEETVEKKVALDRIRIQVGGDDDDLIPKTLEACRRLAMGGEIVEENNKKVEQAVDEATGLSGWATVTVKKTTVRQYDREEKERAAEKLRLARQEREAERKRAEGRRMEEGKFSNADDSALGAYDVWGKGDYKGIDISKDTTLSVEDTANKLSTGTSGKVAFKKKKKKKGQAARRTKSADDD
ncbi:MAG: hypothetical protein SGARI_001495 [Bacillariaceae sp.]